MDEFGEEFKIYVWPKGHEDGDPFPEDFSDKLRRALASVDILWETV